MAKPDLGRDGFRLSPMAVNALKLVGMLFAIALGLVVTVKCAAFVAPFVVAFFIASMAEPLVRWMNGRLHLSRGWASAIVVVLVVLAVLGVLGGIALKLVAEARDLAVKLPDMYAGVSAWLGNLMTEMDARYEFINEETTQVIAEAFAKLRSGMLGFVNTFSRGVWSTAVSVPQGIVTIIVTLLATFFLVRDREKITAQMHSHLPERWILRSIAVRDDLFSALFGYVRALLILMCVTFVELLVGFSLVGVRYAILFALVIAALDALPVLGTGTIVVPWAIYNLLNGDIRTAVGLLLVFAVVWVVRQLLEPRVVGDQIGMHPLLTLLSMFIGMRLMGVLGMILGPVAMILVRNLFGIYAHGRSLREMLYQGMEMPEEEIEKSRKLREPAPPTRLSFSERLVNGAVDRIKRLFSRR